MRCHLPGAIREASDPISRPRLERKSDTNAGRAEPAPEEEQEDRERAERADYDDRGATISTAVVARWIQ